MYKIGSFSISGSVHAIRMKLGMDIKYIKCNSHTSFAGLFCIQRKIIDAHKNLFKNLTLDFSQRLWNRANSSLVCL